MEFRDHDTYIQKKLEQRKTKHGGSGLVKKETVVRSSYSISINLSHNVKSYGLLVGHERNFQKPNHLFYNFE